MLSWMKSFLDELLPHRALNMLWRNRYQDHCVFRKLLEWSKFKQPLRHMPLIGLCSMSRTASHIFPLAHPLRTGRQGYAHTLPSFPLSQLTLQRLSELTYNHDCCIFLPQVLCHSHEWHNYPCQLPVHACIFFSVCSHYLLINLILCMQQVIPPHIGASVGALDGQAFSSAQDVPTTHEHMTKASYSICT